MLNCTTDDLLDYVKARTAVPDPSMFTPARILRFATGELLSFIYPNLASMRNGYYGEKDDQLAVSGQLTYRLPIRAFGSRIESVSLVSNEQLQYNPESLGNLCTLTYPQAQDLITWQNAGSFSSEVPYYYPRNNSIMFYPQPTPGKTIRTLYTMRPNQLALVSDTRTITGLSATTITLSTTLATLVTGTLFDVVDQNSPFKTLAFDQSGTVSTNVITMAAVPTSLKLGDVVSLANQSCIPQVPYELQFLLYSRTCARILETLNDKASAAAMYQETSEQMAQFMNVVAPRVSEQGEANASSSILMSDLNFNSGW